MDAGDKRSGDIAVAPDDEGGCLEDDGAFDIIAYERVEEMDEEAGVFPHDVSNHLVPPHGFILPPSTILFICLATGEIKRFRTEQGRSEERGREREREGE